jgi:quercetin dioxygenase-like cupin family protein
VFVLLITWWKQGEKTTMKRSQSLKSPACKASKMAPGKVLCLVDWIDYANESIVSRVLVDNAAGTVTLFAFDAGQGLSEHTAPFDALVQVIDGEGRFSVGGKVRRVGAGQALLMPANVPHSVKAGKPFKMLLTMLRSKK